MPDESRHFLQSNNETILNVDVIGEKALIKSAILSENIQEIPSEAFFNSQLTSVTIPSSVETIGELAFYHCSQLTSVTIPDSVTTIENGTFSGCSQLTSVTIPNSVETIGEFAFYYCSQLTSVTIQDSVTTIENGTFSGCSQLASITIPNSVTTIGGSAFSFCSQLTSITIPDSVTTIGSWAFSYCSQLTSVTIPNSVTTIGSWAFSYCSQLTSVTIPDSMTTIGSGAFYGTTIQSIKINCNTSSNNSIIAILGKMGSASCNPNNVNTLKVALSPSLLAAKNPGEIKDYVQGILSIASPTDNAIINAVNTKSAIFELDLSNTDLVQADINEMAKTLPWRVIFKNGQVDYAITPQ